MPTVHVTIAGADLPAWLSAIGTLLAVAVALLGRVLWRWWYRPRLVLAYSPREPFTRHTKTTQGPAFWVRVLVRNEGRGTAKHCFGKITRVRDPSGAPRQDRDPMQLRWSATSDERAMEPVTLPPQDSRFLDVLVAFDKDRSTVHFALADPTPPGHATWLEADRKHLITVAVFADNAKVQKDFSVCYDSASGNLAVEPS